jgi:hypothetical protein
MSEPLPHLIEKSIQIAWDYLERTGEIADADEASRFLLRSVDQMVMQVNAAGCWRTAPSMPTAIANCGSLLKEGTWKSRHKHSWTSSKD